MANSNNKLFSQFPPVSSTQWMNKITEDLKGADFEKRLVWKTTEGFNVNPFYRKEDLEGLNTNVAPGQFPFTRGNKYDSNRWYIRQDISTDDVTAANEKAKTVLTKGVDSLGFSIKGSAVSQDFIENLLNGIDAEKVELNFKVCIKKTVEFAKLLVAYFEKKDYCPDKLIGSIAFDPIGKQLTRGKVLGNRTETLKQMVEVCGGLQKYSCATIEAKDMSDAGAYIAHELGYALSWGNEYLNMMTEAGISADVAASKIKFNFGISSSFFMEIAKFRAARMLWAQIVETYKPESTDTCKMRVHATTTNFNLTLYDAHVNMLRTQTEAMSAALAGVDSITVTPYDAVYETPTEFAERIARNQQLILKHESHLDKVVDPSAGSYYIETLTASIAKEAWKLFLKTEEEGGFLQAVTDEKVQNAINKDGATRRTALAKRREILLGTNQYPNFTETAGDKKPLSQTCCCSNNSEQSCETILDNSRLARDFETLRLQTENSGKKPKAFMLTIGNLAMRQARAQFSCNFLAVAGYEVIDNLGFANINEGIEAAIKANADIVVLCSSDDEYAEYAVEAYNLLGSKAIFIIAGAPACMEELQKAGIENFIHVRVDILETMQNLNKKLGI